MKRVLPLILLLSLYPSLSRFCTDKTGGFTINQITATLPYNTAWESNVPLPDLKIFEQKFHYLNHGGQSYVFLSEDGQFVLKLVKNYLYFPLSFIESLPLVNKKKSKMMRDFTSYKLAFEELANESGLIYLHLNPTKNLLPKVTLFDKLGIEHVISLDGTLFILQKKADLLYPHLNALMKVGDIDGAKSALSSLLTLLKIRLEKGIYDEDAKLHRNCGFIDNKALFIDVGRFCKSSKTQSFEEMTKRLNLWLEENYPELASYVKNEIPIFEPHSI
jgi:hypothetical protein